MEFDDTAGCNLRYGSKSDGFYDFHEYALIRCSAGQLGLLKQDQPWYRPCSIELAGEDQELRSVGRP
jgi:hypothetical protein